MLLKDFFRVISDFVVVNVPADKVLLIRLMNRLLLLQHLGHLASEVLLAANCASEGEGRGLGVGVRHGPRVALVNLLADICEANVASLLYEEPPR